jgi:hypothetical protein
LRKFPALRPRTYAEEVQRLIERTAQKGGHISLWNEVWDEVAAISKRSGVSIDSTLGDLVKAGIVSRFHAAKTGRGGFGG